MYQQSTSLDTVWQTALGELEVVLSKASFTTWFRETFIADISPAGTIVIGVPHSFALEWLSNKYQTHIFEVLRRLLPDVRVETVEFKIARMSQKELNDRDADIPLVPTYAQPGTTKTVVLEESSPSTTFETPAFNLQASHTFAGFIIGSHNRLAHAASLAVATEPGRRHNPLFIYGGVGLGKTHLIQAIGNHILREAPGKKILYASCERFANEFIQAIQTNKMDNFKEKYRNVDVLLIDDIQFLASKDRTQEEFFHTFNALHQSNRQIVLTSDRMPQAIPQLEDRLSSRFVWGMVTDIKGPDLETREAILKQKSEERGVNLELDVIQLIAQTYRQNIRELEGALNQILAYCELEQTSPTLKLVEQLIKSNQPHKKRVLSADQIFQIISDHFQIEREDLLGIRRNKEFVYPRQITMYLLRHELGFSFPKIGQELGKDHTTIMHGVDKIEKELPKNGHLQQELTSLKDQLYAS